MNTFQSYLCNISVTRSSHLAKDLRILPCGGVACLDCIRANLDYFGILQCPLCKQSHVVTNTEKDLKTGSYRELEMRRLLPCISAELNMNLKMLTTQLKGYFN